jgi:hypothetical protein
MVQAGFEVFAYCDNFLFLESCNLSLQSFQRIGYPSSIPKCARSDCRSGLQKVRAVRDCRTGPKCRRDVNRFR